MKNTSLILYFLFFANYFLVGCGGSSGSVIDTSTFSSPTPCVIDAVNSKPCSVESTDVAVTKSIGENVVQWSNSQSSTSISAEIPAGFYTDKTVSFDDPELKPSNIKAGVTIFGVTGNASGILGDCNVNGLQSASCTAAANSFWTTILGTNVNGSAGSLAATIPAGYYDGSKTATMSDSNLIASNIKFGTTIFGVAGSLTSVYPTCVEDNGTINAAVCSTGATNRYVSSVLGDNITSGSNAGATTTVSAAIPNGYYNGKSVSFTDANLVASKIVSGNTIFGVAGNATAAYSACTDNVLNGSQCSTASANRYVTPTLGSAVSSWTNLSAGTVVSGTIPQGFYNSGTAISFSEANLLASNIKFGTTVFGVTGSLTSVYPTCVEDNGTINAAVCSTGATNRYVSSVLGDNITSGSNAGATTTVSAAIPNGYYNGKTVSFTDANLVASKIVSGNSIFGVSGSATAAYTACIDDTLNASQCSTTTSRYVTPTAGSDVSVWTNTLASTTVAATIANGFYSSKSCLLADANLIASNIKSGTSIFGVTGNLTSTYSTCQEDNGTINAAICTTSVANRYVSSVLGANITSGSNAGATTTVSAAIPNGYYNGKSVNFTDANLVASKILNGTTIFGVTGNVVAAYDACTDNDLNASQCSTAANRYVSATLGSNITVSGGTSATIAQGFYDGTKSCQVSDANLSAGNIKSGVTILGVSGTVTPAYSACTDDALNASQCSTAANRYVTSVNGANTTIWTNVGATTTVTANLTNAYYNGKSCQLTDAGLVAENISAGTSIFGVSGTATLAYSNCSEDTGTVNGARCSTTAANRYVSSVLGNDITTGTNGGASTTVSATIPDGYYKTKTVSFTDANLVASKILNGTTIFGVTGNVVAAYGTCTDNDLNASQCSTAANRYVSATLGSNITVSGGTSATITQGFYDGTKSCQVSDANLSAGNIKSGVTILGVEGTLAGAYSACTDDNYNAGQCSTAAARYVTATLGSAITSWTNASSGTTVSGSIPGGFYPTSPLSISFNDANLLAANIISGKTIFNVAGTANIFMSNVHRDQATTEISQVAETTTYAGAALPAGYRDVPDITKDDDGYQSAGTTSPQVTLATRPTVNCGTTQNTIAGRISDCVTQNGANATWDGAVKGNAGQGKWKLVTRAAANKEVWQDQRTGLLWSSILNSSTYWCLAAGNGQTTGNGYAANDPSGYCNSATYQSNYVNNTTAFNVQSWCAETGPAGVTLVPVSGNGENWSTPTYDNAKGGMGKTSTASSPSIRWRLPTKYDYQQADNNGIRFVMPGMANTGGGFEWSASVSANFRDYAWGFNGSNGYVGINSRDSDYSVRCVGR